jgi:integrase
MIYNGIPIFLDKYVQHLHITAKVASVMRAVHAVNHLTRLNLYPRLGESISAKADAYVAARRKEGAADTTINAELRVLRAAINFDGNDGSAVKLLREERRLPTILIAAESERLLDAAGQGRVRTACLLALYAGLRHEEIKHLRWEDVREGELRVAPWGGWSPKNHAERALPLHLRIQEDLNWSLSDGAREPLIVGPDDLFVPIREAFKRAGLRRVDGEGREGLHMLRRTFASRMLANGADINTVRELMGHADLATTQRYLVSSLPQKRAAVAGL